MSFTPIDITAANTAASGTTFVRSANFADVQAGDLIVAIVGNGDGGATSLSVSDGTTTFTPAASPISYGGGNGQIAMHYLLASVATGSPTYTLTHGAARTYRSIVLMQFRPSAAVSFGNIAQDAGTGTAISSGNLSVSGSDIMGVGGAFTYNTANVSAISPLINSLAATAQANNAYTLGWYRAFASGFTGAATATLGGSDQWGSTFGYFTIGGAATNYPLTAAQGSFALTGQAATLTKAGGGYTLAAAQGSFTLTGSEALRDIAMNGAQGAFAMTGRAANLGYGRKLIAAQGSFTRTGQSAGLIWSNAPAPVPVKAGRDGRRRGRLGHWQRG